MDNQSPLAIMAASPSGSFQSMLHAAVQSVQWTYSLFWQFCPQQGILKWGDGCYNGAIKTRKSTVQAILEVSNGEESLQRSQQLRELYESLSAGDTEPPTRRPCAASLSPEDLTECEWFYLMCASFSFSPGVGLPGKAYARRQHVWLAGADQADSKTFARAILARSARVQTVVCIPLLEGVVEFGTTDKVQEDFDFIELVKSFFIGHHHLPTPKQALSEHSTSASSYPVIAVSNMPNDHENMEMEKHDKEEAELLDSESAETVLLRGFPPNEELMDLQDMLEASQVGSPDDGSNLLCSAGLELLQVESASVAPAEDLLIQGNEHYSQTVSTILQNSYGQWLESPSISHLASSFHSAFAEWSTMTYNCHLHMPVADTPQWLLKYILFRVPYLHAKQHHHNSPQTPDRGRAPPQDEQNVGHVAAERRRREKLNEKFMTLRSLVPFVTKIDKASILGDTIEYVKQLQEKIRDLEARSNHMMEDDQRWRSVTKRKEGVVEVSITEGEVLLEVECMQKEGLLLDVMGTLREVGIEVIWVQSSMKDDGVFAAQLKAKVKENAKSKKVSIVEVKKALHKVIYTPSSSTITLASRD